MNRTLSSAPPAPTPMAVLSPAPIATHPPSHAERATMVVLVLTVATMVVEIGAGWWTGSMALLADGWHMSMHAAAMGVAVFAYRFARRHQASARYTFGAGKAADLGAFANAVMLAVVAVLVAGESATRLVRPGPIDFSAAMLVAVVGLGVNLLSAWLLREVPHAHGCGHHHADHNREAAFAHVLADALTSVLALAALYAGRRFGLVWLDPLMGLVGAAVILRWSAALVKRAGAVLLDAAPVDGTPERIRAIVEGHGDRVDSLQVWPIAAGRYAAVLRLASGQVCAYRQELNAVPGLDYLVVDGDGIPPPRFTRPVFTPATGCCGHSH